VLVNDTSLTPVAVTPDSYSLTVTPASVEEGGNAVFQLTLDKAATSVVNVNYVTTTGTAGGADYVSSSGTITFAVGQNTQFLSIATTEDTAFEADETFTVTFTGTSLAAAVTATGTITNDDANPDLVAQTFALTSNVDAGAAYTGRSGNDTFNAGIVNNLATLNNLDAINGGNGTDTLNVELNGVSVTPAALTSIEQITIISTAGNSTLGLDNATGTTSINSNGSTGTLTLNNVGSGVAVTIANTSAAHTVNYTTAAVAGTADLASISVNSFAATLDNTADMVIGAGVETLALNTTGINTFDTDFAGAVVVSGTGTLNMTGVAGNLLATTIDASANTGAITVVMNAASTVTGGSGNDNITGSGAADVLSGGAGNDSITGGAGVDTLTGGDGNDTFLYATSAELIAATGAADAVIDSVAGGGGNNVVSVAGAISIGAVGADSLARITGVQTLTQTAGAGSTVVLATDAALSDFRTINLAAATAANTVTLTGVTANMTVTGSNAAASADSITGGSGNDSLTGGLGQNTLAGGDGADTITMGADAENINGGAGNDLIVGGANLTDTDTVVGGAGTDTLTLNGDITTTAANLVSGVEVLTLASEVDAVGANTGNQYVLVMDNDNDTDAAATTTDVMTINAFALVADADADTAGNQAETLNFTGTGTTTHLYSVTGGAGNDTLVGGNLADTIVGGAGNDQITGGAGTDSLDGGEGSDTYTYADAQFVAADVIADSGTTGTDTVAITSTTAITDAMFANKSGLEAATLSSAVTYTLGTNAQASGITAVTMGAAGTLVASAYTVGLTVTDAAAATTITTGSGNDTVTLAAGNDSVTLGAGNDTVVGGANVTADDTLAGGDGTDVLTLNSGAAAGANVTTTIVFDADFTGFEQITVAAGTEAVAVANAGDTLPSINDYTLTLVDANVAAASTFVVDASALRTGIITAFGADGEIGGADADTTTGEENLVLTASALTGTRAINVTGGAGADSITGGAGADIITGGAGADTLIGGAGADVISGGVGADSIDGGAGNDNLTGGAGNDTITGGAGADNLDGGEGDDTFVFTYTQFNGDADTVIGGAGTNTIEITSENLNRTVAEVGFNSRVANVSNVLLTGDANGGADAFTWTLGTFSRAAGLTTVTMGANATGNIDATSNAAAVTLVGGTGADSLTGSALGDSITGGAGADTLVGNAGNDTINGGTGADNDVIDAGEGDDFVTLGGTGNDSVTLGAGNDTVVGGANVTADDTLAGGDGTDVLTLNSGAAAGANVTTTIVFDADFTGFEQITVAAGTEAVAVANAGDTLPSINDYTLTLVDANVAAASTFVVDASALRTGIITAFGADGEIGGADADTTTGEENLVLTASALTGTRAINVTGGAGADSITGGAGADIITGGAGADTLIGGAGADVISGGVGADSIDGGAGNDNLTGGAGNDTITGGAGTDLVDGGDGTDTYIIGAYDTNTPTVQAGEGTVTGAVINLSSSTLTYAAINAATGSYISGSLTGVSANTQALLFNGENSLNIASIDTFVSIENATGGASADYIVGSSGDNVLNGDGGNDTIVGGGGNDTLIGGAGTDSLVGGSAADVFTGGAGIDTIVSGGGDDTITDLNTGNAVDVIVFSGTETIATAVVGGDYLGQAFSSNAAGFVQFSEVAGYDPTSNDPALNTSQWTLVEKKAAVQGNANLSAADKVSMFTDGSDSYVYYSGATTAASDDQFLKIEGSTTFTALDAAPAAGFSLTSSVVAIASTFTVASSDFTGNNRTNNALTVFNFNGSGTVDALYRPMSTAWWNPIGWAGASASTFTAAGGDTDLAAFLAANTTLKYSDAYVSSWRTSTPTGARALDENAETVSMVLAPDAYSSFYGQAGGVGNIHWAMTGGSAADLIFGSMGNDTLIGNGGADFILGGDGNDTITGGDGADTMLGGAGNDTINMGTGDKADGGAGTDAFAFAAATAGATVIGGAGADTISLGNFANTLTISDVDGIAITGGTGIDALTFTAAVTATTVVGGAGADTIALGNFANTLTISDVDGIAITGGTGIDALTFTAAVTATTVVGGAGADTITLGNFANTLTISDVDGIAITGGTGIDALTFTAAVTATTVVGGAGADTIVLGNFANTLTISDVDGIAITGGTGIDALTFTAAVTATTVVGGGGADTIALGNFTNAITAGSTGGTVVVTGGTGADTIVITTGNSTVNGGGGADVITAGAGVDTINVGEGNNTVNFAAANAVRAVVDLTLGATAGLDDGDTFTGVFDTVASLAANDTLDFLALTLAVEADDGGAGANSYQLIQGTYAAGVFTVDGTTGLDTLLLWNDAANGDNAVVLTGITDLTGITIS
jgi:trimeric autotransporter adhesin